MRHLTSGKAMTRFHEFNPWPPIARDEGYNGNPLFKEMYEKDYEAFRPLPLAPHGFKIYDYLYKQLQLMMIGEKTPEEALADAEKYSNDLLQQ